MREIKFRAWDKNNHEMKTGEYVMQYTGLKDKKGVEVYEGDILSHFEREKHGIKCRYIVSFGEYDNGHDYEDMVYGRGFYITNIYSKEGSWDKIEHFTSADYLEVIGNIYENPELINNIEKGK